MKYLNSIGHEAKGYLDFAFREMFEGESHWVNENEFLDMLLDCQAGQALANFAIHKADDGNMDIDLFVDIAPQFRIDGESNSVCLQLFADRSVWYSARNYPAQVYIDIDDFIAARPDLFQIDTVNSLDTLGVMLEPFENLLYFISFLPERFADRKPGGTLNSREIRELVLSGEYRKSFVLNNRLLLRSHTEAFYRDMGALHDEIFFEDVCYEIRLEQAAELESQTV